MGQNNIMTDSIRDSRVAAGYPDCASIDPLAHTPYARSAFARVNQHAHPDRTDSIAYSPMNV
jgi:hypothetical protein